MKLAVQQLSHNYPGSLSDFLRKRLWRFTEDAPGPGNIDPTLTAADISIPHLVPQESYPALSPAMSKKVESAKACAKSLVDRDYPLIYGETLLEEYFTYLSEASPGHAAGTPVLVQKTNYATIFIFFDNVQIAGDRIIYLPPAPMEPSTAPVLPRDEIVTTIALGLAEALLGKIADEVGSAIYAEVLKGLDIKVAEPLTAEAIRKVVNEELSSTVISEVNGSTKGVVNWQCTTFVVFKKDPARAKEMKGELTTRITIMNEVIGKLQQSQFAHVGFPAFLVSASVLFSLYQDLALLDMPSDPRSSPYATALSNMANSLATYGEQTYGAIKRMRSDAFRSHYRERRFYNSGEIITSQYYEWEDAVTGASNKFEYNALDKQDSLEKEEQKCTQSMNNARDLAMTQLDKDVGQATDVLSKWRALAQTPIG